jgi:hypothetical protein
MDSKEQPAGRVSASMPHLVALESSALLKLIATLYLQLSTTQEELLTAQAEVQRLTVEVAHYRNCGTPPDGSSLTAQVTPTPS